ncbi:Exodeoxyribonuclease III [Rickettsiales bacterium Ac37b]|nr:Exodeoxyribonuclease III [Rickettsiales bacterium Ac37b]
MIKIANWNINSVRTRLPLLLSFLEQESPDIVCLQETKCINEQFPTLEIESLGYNFALHGQKSYNGVAILSKFPLEDISIKMHDGTDDVQARYIEVIVNVSSDRVLRVISCYVPNGAPLESEKFIYKLNFLDQLYERVQQLLKFEEILVVMGDFNVAPEDIDVYDREVLNNTVCFHIEEKVRFRKIIYAGMNDAFRMLYPDRQEFTWWDYRAGSWQHNSGMRIDHILLSPQAADLLKAIYIRKDMRAVDKASDHVPIVCELE